jgi:nucleotide-binding universal stress UspA family protein
MKPIEMKKVLIALDYDPSSKKVAETGYAIADAMNAEVTLLHVITDPVYYSSQEYSPILGFGGQLDVAPIQLDSAESLIKASQHFLDIAKQHLGNKDIKTMVKDGDYADSILKAAKELHADFLVLGSHSRKWLQNLVIGSVSEKVLHHTTIPVFIIPIKPKKKS